LDHSDRLCRRDDRPFSPSRARQTDRVLTTALGIAGAFLSTFIGQPIGWYQADQGAGFVAATIGAVLVLFVWNRLIVNRTINDPGVR
jgi:uncharacterized membrane protein YeaQ/YmgE (transglycosylase-associated protein family)